MEPPEDPGAKFLEPDRRARRRTVRVREHDRVVVDRDPQARARTMDPETSHAAAASLSIEQLRASQREVYDLFLLNGDMTDEQVADVAVIRGVKQSPSGLRTRRKELVEGGMLEDSGRRASLRSGRSSIVWRIRARTR